MQVVGVMVDGQVDSSEVEDAGMNSPGEAVCLTNNICTKAVAEVQTTIVIVVTIMAKVGDQQPTITTLIIITIPIMAVPTTTTTINMLESIIIMTIQVVDLSID